MSKTILLSSTFLLLIGAMGSVQSAERPTLNHTNDPRPDILPHPFYYAHTEYRLAYNRPRDFSGWIANKIAPSSQEAMVWKENVQAGNYDQKHTPPMYKRYCYPKPWEVLLTGARPDFPKPATGSSYESSGRPADPMPEAIEAAQESTPIGGYDPPRIPPVPVPILPVR